MFRYRNRFGCSNIDLSDTDEWYARFTTSTICNALVQIATEPCDLSDSQSRPLCADSCAEFAQSEAYLTSDDELCSNPNPELTNFIRSDFAICASPRSALGDCVSGSDNEKDNCGFGNSTIGFCAYCAQGGVNSTDTSSCCYKEDAEKRCEGVELPALATTISLDTPTATGDPTEDGDDEDDDGLSGGAIAGIVIGSVAAVALIAAALFFCLRRRKQRRGSHDASVFNQPSPTRQGPPSMKQAHHQEAPQGYEVLPGGRIARMSALEGHSGDDGSHHHGKSLTAAAAGAGAGFVAGHRNNASSSDFGSMTPGSTGHRRPPTAFRRNGSLSSNSIFNSSVPQSPTSNAGFSSPQGVASQQSEQLPFFKDYYSPDDIHPGDRVSVLWAYQPRAADEFTLDRGDMLKIVGIWDDGWATGVMLSSRADEWDTRRSQRDSGVSHASGRRGSSAATSSEIKAFPLVCVCLPDHWRKTIEGDASTDTGSLGPGHVNVA